MCLCVCVYIHREYLHDPVLVRGMFDHVDACLSSVLPKFMIP